MSKEPTKQIPENAQVESDDDLDDLDDVLDKFNELSPSIPSLTPRQPTTTTSTTTTTTATTTTTRPRHNTRVDAPPRSIPGSGHKLDSTTEEGDINEDALSREFAQELAKGMESLMREITSGLDPSASSSSSSAGGANKVGGGGSGGGDGGVTEADGWTDDERSKAFKAAWEAMLLDGLNGNDENALEGLGEPYNAEGSDPKPTSNDFQNTIKQAMGKLKESESNLQSGPGSTGAPPPTDSLESLLKSLGDLGLGGGDGEEDEELAGFLENMMGQLLTKEVLYEPLKELADNFPGYLANPPKPIEPDDKTRYEKQNEYVKQIIEIFEKPTYDDADAETSKTIMALMSEMQSYGSPPPEIMGPLPPGFAGGIPHPGGEECIIT